MVVHAQRDYLLAVSAGFQLFTTLQRLGIPSKMLYFPDDGHFIQKPQNDQVLYKTVNEWGGSVDEEERSLRRLDLQRCGGQQFDCKNTTVSWTLQSGRPKMHACSSHLARVHLTRRAQLVDRRHDVCAHRADSY